LREQGRCNKERQHHRRASKHEKLRGEWVLVSLECRPECDLAQGAQRARSSDRNPLSPLVHGFFFSLFASFCSSFGVSWPTSTIAPVFALTFTSSMPLMPVVFMSNE